MYFVSKAVSVHSRYRSLKFSLQSYMVRILKKNVASHNMVLTISHDQQLAENLGLVQYLSVSD